MGREAIDGGTIADLIQEVLSESRESAEAYLVQSWIDAMLTGLRDARLQAGMTQSAIAERLKTTQSAIARLERDDVGRIQLRRFVEYALACGVLPLNPEFAQVEELRQFSLSNPHVPRTANSFYGWKERKALSDRFETVFSRLLDEKACEHRQVTRDASQRRAGFQRWRDVATPSVRLGSDEVLGERSHEERKDWGYGSDLMVDEVPEGLTDTDERVAA